MKLSDRSQLLKEADIVLEKINIKIIQESDYGEEHVAYYSSNKIATLILSSILWSIPVGPFAIIPFTILIALNWDYIRGYIDEREIIKMINDRNLNGDPELKKLLELLLDDLKNSQDVKNIRELLMSAKKLYETNQNKLHDFYREINSKWYMSKNPDEIVPENKMEELNKIKKEIQDSYEKYQEEIMKQTFLLTRKILSSDKYESISSIGKSPTSGKPSKYAYLKRLATQVKEYLLKSVDPNSVKDLHIKMVPKSQQKQFFNAGF
jgi:hypothetical protein